MNACLNATEARAYLRVSERQWNKLVAAGLVKKLPTLGSYSRTMLDELIRDEEQRAKTVVRLRLEENDEADTEEGRALDQAWDWVAPVVPGLSRNYPELAAELRKREGQ